MNGRKLYTSALAALLVQPVTLLAAETPKLSALDYIEIEQLVYKYAYALDHCSDNGESYASLYVEDGEFGSTPDWDVPPQKLIKGHEALAKIGGGGGPGGVCKDPKLGKNYGATHLTVDIVITPVPGGVIGKSIPLLIGADGDPTKIVRQGGKQDFFVKTANGWRFKSEWHVALAGTPAAQPPAPSPAPNADKPK